MNFSIPKKNTALKKLTLNPPENFSSYMCGGEGGAFL
jgi:hypothetical protein